jgi:hypothetical protein
MAGHQYLPIVNWVGLSRCRPLPVGCRKCPHLSNLAKLRIEEGNVRKLPAAA